LIPGTNLYTVHPDGGALQRLTQVTPSHYVLSGTYSPDGTAVVFATDEDGTPNPRGGTFAEVVTMKLTDRLTAHVTGSPNLDGWPSWGSSH
jgi:Tol biopolymer transport system component